MAASDNFTLVGEQTLTSLDAPGKAIGAGNLNIIDPSNWPTASGVIFAIRVVDSSLVSSANPAGEVPNTYTEWAGQLAGSTISGLILLIGTDQVYSEGVNTQMYVPLSSTWANRLINALLQEHKQSGAHKDVTADSLTIGSTLIDAEPWLPWTSWTPTLANITIGNGTLVAKYTRIGKTIRGKFIFTLGSTSVIGTGPSFTLPVPEASDHIVEQAMGSAAYIQAGVSTWAGVLALGASHAVSLRTLANLSSVSNISMNSAQQLTATAPFAFGTNDSITCHFEYEAA